MSAQQLRCGLRTLDPRRHPLLATMTREVMYDRGRMMAPGGLYLAQQMSHALGLQPGQRVLDLGCGRGQSSAFLAARHDVDVVSVDAWIDVGLRRHEARRWGVEHRITSLQADFRRGLPAGIGAFDHIFCMQAFHCFGAAAWAPSYVASLLRPGGQLCLAQTCFDREVAPLPPVFRDTDGWRSDYGSYHSPSWWRRHLESRGELEVTHCEELPDGDVLWEDDVLYRGDACEWREDFVRGAAWLCRQLLWGHTRTPRLTHFLLLASHPTSAARIVSE
jgi:SAM-dependent methyltransferase